MTFDNLTESIMSEKDQRYNRPIGTWTLEETGDIAFEMSLLPSQTTALWRWKQGGRKSTEGPIAYWTRVVGHHIEVCSIMSTGGQQHWRCWIGSGKDITHVDQPNWYPPHENKPVYKTAKEAAITGLIEIYELITREMGLNTANTVQLLRNDLEAEHTEVTTPKITRLETTALDGPPGELSEEFAHVEVEGGLNLNLAELDGLAKETRELDHEQSADYLDTWQSELNEQLDTDD